MRHLMLPLLLVLCSVSCRCGAKPAPATPDVACRTVFQSLAESTKRCSPLATDALFQELAESTCREMVKSISASRMAFDSTQLDACAEALRTVDCGQRDVPPGPCTRLFAGRVPAGGACFNSDECEGLDALHCRTTGGCPGQCVATVPIGGACGEDDRCAHRGDCVEGVCRAPGRVGDECGEGGRRCAAEFYCDTSRYPGRCQKKKERGEPCNDAEACAGRLTCLGFSFLGGGAGECQPPRGEGAECAGLLDCELGLVCRTSSSTPDAPGRCARTKKVGEACAFGESECDSPASCDPTTGRCVAPAKVGESCGFVEEGDKIEIRSCQAGFCHTESKSCTAWKPPGAECEELDSACEFGCGEDRKCQQQTNPDCHAP